MDLCYRLGFATVFGFAAANFMKLFAAVSYELERLSLASLSSLV
jgi:hypothetical protein